MDIDVLIYNIFFSKIFVDAYIINSNVIDSLLHEVQGILTCLCLISHVKNKLWEVYWINKRLAFPNKQSPSLHYDSFNLVIWSIKEHSSLIYEVIEICDPKGLIRISLSPDMGSNESKVNE